MDFTGGITFTGGVTITPTAAVAANDPYFMYNSLLLPGDGTNLAQNNTFLDGSTNNFTITRNGNTTQGTFSPYGANWSNYFDGASDYLSMPSSSAFAFGTGDFTLEAFIFVTKQANVGQNNDIFTFSDDRNNCGIEATGTLYYFDGSFRTTSAAVSVGVWSHVAYSRTSGTMSIYLNGIRYYNASDTTNQSARVCRIGTNYNAASSYFNGYISNMRVLKGTGLYTGATITVPTSPLTAITNTQLLTCQNNRFIDNSSNALTVTPTGDTNVQRFSPFSPTAAYSAGTIGGSGYFDGTGDYLSAGSNSAFAVGTGDFTFQVWVYPTAYTSPVGAIFDTGSGVASGRFSVVLYANGILRVDNNTNLLSSSSALPLNQWTFISIIRSSGTMTMYFNGTSVASGSITNNFTETQGIIGKTVDNYYFQGYISNFSLVKGTALANTVPTTPLTAIANTSLLLNYTNAGIIDNAMMNNLETVGNAQISTAQSKFGGSSMYFDGTGDYLTAPNTVNANFNNGDFTVEFWMYASSQALAPIVHQTSYANNQGWIIWNYTGDNVGTATRKLTFMANGATFVLTTSSDAYTDNTWTHIAIVKNGTGSNNIKIYSNGTSIATGTYATALANPSTPLMVGGIINGQSWNGTSYFNGYLDDLRITKGLARYTANFTPPTAALPTY